MLKALALLLVLAPVAAFAQSAGGYSVDPSKEAPQHSLDVKSDKPSPEHTQDRVFGATRFWLLDPGRYEVEVWYDHKLKKQDEADAHILKAEIEIGLAPHLQLDIYQNFTTDGGTKVEGNQLELRYSFGRHYNDVPLNPVLYLEWHPRHLAQDRAEVRLLMGGDIGKFLWAANLYAETNVDDFDEAYAEGKDAELGATIAGSYGIGDYFRLGAEVQAGGDQHGGPDFKPVLMAGPNVLLKIPHTGLKLTGTSLFGIASDDPRVRLLLIAGYEF